VLAEFNARFAADFEPMELPKILGASDRHREVRHEAITVGTRPFVNPGDDTKTEENMLHVLGEPP